MRCSVAIVVLVLAASAVATRKDYPNVKSCNRVVCDTAIEFADNECTPDQVVRKAYKAGAKSAPSRDGEPLYGKCCDTFVCVQDPNNPCGGKECAANTLEQATANCNNLYPNDPISTALEPNYGAMYAVLHKPAKGVAGRCCDEFKCKTDNVVLCENLVKKTPCATSATCPLGHYAEVVLPKDPDNKRCCDELRCVPDAELLCDLQEQPCPSPDCDASYESIQLQMTINLWEADPYAGRCCPRRTCQNNLPAICEAYRLQNNIPDDYDELCPNDCEQTLIIEPEAPEFGRCIPKYECVPKANAVCCGFDTSKCPGEPENLGVCESARVSQDANEAFGPCCDVWTIQTDDYCVCDAIIAGDPCPFVDELEYYDLVCADMQDPRSEADSYTVDVTLASPEAGRCCDQYKCVPTAVEQLRRARVKKGPTNKKLASTISA